MTEISIKKPYRRWLFGGIGFHNSEATMAPVMNEKFKNERALKCFREISPTYSRVFAGYHDWTKEAMDHFADYYDKTFRDAGTTLYLVPGRIPIPDEDFDIEEYCERTAANLEYLIKVRGCTKIQHFCLTNELSCGNTYAYLERDLDLFKKLQTGLYKSFQRHGLDIGLLATDCSGESTLYQVDWAIENMDEITSDYCTHLYLQKYQPEDLEAYEYCRSIFAEQVAKCQKVQKRYVIGEYGIKKRGWANDIGKYPMWNNVSYNVDCPENDALYALAIAEMSAAIVNSGTFAACLWTMIDYPDPMIKENGDTPEEKARYEVCRFSGHGMQIRYNKNGLIRWCDDEHDYSAKAGLYTMGYMAKLFKKGSRVLECSSDDELIRTCAVTNSDGSVSICIINRNTERTDACLKLEHECKKPLRRYDFLVSNPNENKFCDLQDFSALVDCNGSVVLSLEGQSVTFLTTDYENTVPSPVLGVMIKKGKLVWKPSKDKHHCYYRVFASTEKNFSPCYENQIASTVAEYLDIEDENLNYRVISVNKYGNAGK